MAVWPAAIVWPSELLLSAKLKPTINSTAAERVVWAASVPVATILSQAMRLNVLLAVFNMIPIPPLDGSHVFKYVLPPAWALSYERVSRYGLLVIYAVLFLGGVEKVEGILEDVPFRCQRQDGGTIGRKCEAEDAGRGQVLGRVEAAIPLLGVEEVAVPVRLVRVRPVGRHVDGGHTLVRHPHPAVAAPLGLEPEGRVLVMEGVVVAARQKRADLQGHPARAGRGGAQSSGSVTGTRQLAPYSLPSKERP